MSTFRVPPGDPHTLRGVVSALSDLSSRVGETRTARVRAAAETAEGALPSARVADFAGARRDATTATAGVGLSLVTVGGALGEYATALESAQGAVRAAAADHEQAEVLWRRARSTGDDQLAEDKRDEMARHRTTAERAQGDLDDARRGVLQVLRGELDVWVPGGGALTPVQAWEKAATSMTPSGVSLDPQALRDAFTNVGPDTVLGATALMNAITGGVKGYQTWTVIQYLRSPALARSAEAKFLKAQGVYQALKGGTPDLNDKATYKAYLKAEQKVLKAYVGRNPTEVLRAQRHFKLIRGLQGDVAALRNLSRYFPHLTEAQIRGVPGRIDRILGPVRPAARAFGILGPVSVGLGVMDVHSALTDESLATDDAVARGVGGVASIVGGAATTAILLGAAAPILPAVVAVAGVVAVGAWVYENREAIADGAAKVADAVSDGAEKVGGAIADGAKKAWKGLFG